MVPAPIVTPFQAVQGSSAWYSSDFNFHDRVDWIHKLSTSEIAEIDAAVGSVQYRNVEVDDVTLDDFPLPTLAPVLRELQRDVLQGRGFVLLRGLPVERYTLREAAIAYWGLSIHLGRVVPQNKFGHLIGHVKDHGQDPGQRDVRLYATSAAQPCHVDRAGDIISLLCLRNAKEGGFSSWTSSMTIHNEILRTRPDLVKVLAEPWYLDRKGEVPAGKQPFYPMPIFHYHDGLLTVNFSGDYLRSCQRNHPAAPRFSPAQQEALQMVEALAADPRLQMEMKLEPGDIQLIHNHTILHARTAFTDFAEPELRRHLLRTWICPDTARPLPECMAEQYTSAIPGERGGIWVPGVQPHVDLRADR